MDPNTDGSMMFPNGWMGGGYGGGYSGGNSGYGSGGANGAGLGSINDMFGAAGIGSGLGQLFSGLFGKSPGQAALGYLSKIPGQVQPYLNPYMQAGQGALGALGGQYGNLMNNPGGELNQIGSQYHQSPGFNFAMQNALAGANRGAAAGGLAGSPGSQIQNMQTATGLANQDYYNYLGQAQNMYGMGLQGEQGLAGMGAQSAQSMADMVASALGAQANAAYQGQAQKNQSVGGGIGNIIGGIGSLFGL